MLHPEGSVVAHHSIPAARKVVCMGGGVVKGARSKLQVYSDLWALCLFCILVVWTSGIAVHVQTLVKIVTTV